MEHIGTIVVAAILIAVFVLIVAGEIKKRKKGHGCSCGCASCAMADVCHNKKENK